MKGIRKTVLTGEADFVRHFMHLYSAFFLAVILKKLLQQRCSLFDMRHRCDDYQSFSTETDQKESRTSNIKCNSCFRVEFVVPV